MIKPDAYLNIGKILDQIYQAGFQVSRLKMSKFDVDTAGMFYGEHEGKHFYQNLVEFVTSDVAVGIELVAENAVKKWRGLLGPTNTITAREEAPNSLRAQYGTDGTRNAAHGSDSGPSAKRELDLYFQNMKTTALLNNCTCAVIKPHAIKEGYHGKIIDMILEEGFEISAMEMFYIDKPTSEEFLEVYKGVVPEYQPICEHLTTGPVIVMEIRQEDAIESFRKLCGPHDPEIAKVLRPNTIRGKFGKDRVENAIHCTDLEEDGVLECEYFFSILQK